jgi:hypothetical protein
MQISTYVWSISPQKEMEYDQNIYMQYVNMADGWVYVSLSCFDCL